MRTVFTLKFVIYKISKCHRILCCFFCVGFSTSKGELVRSILFPKPFGFKFYQDAMKFIGFLAFMSLLGMAYSVRTLIQQHVRP